MAAARGEDRIESHQFGPRQEAGDLTTCDREPIHIPGSIQPHGALLSLDEDSLSVLQASENVCELFGREASAVLGISLPELLGPEKDEEILHGLRNPFLDKNPLYVGSFAVTAENSPGRTYNVIGHRHEGSLIVEFEAAIQDRSVSFQNLYPLVRTFMARLQEVSTVSELSQMAADEVRRLTGFGRVLVYSFDSEWHGHVIAESRDSTIPSYLDLWFPASDIPAQARELYRVNRLRLIPDCNYRPVPLVPSLNPQTGAPLDLSYAALRSVSPVHIEYLHNMGIVASMSISVIRDGKLWGLISLHHKTARPVPFQTRVACDFLGQALSTQIAGSENRAEYEHRLYLKSITTRLLGFMAEEEHFIDGLVNHPDELLSFAEAGGAAVLFEGQCRLLGQTPPEEMVWALTDWLATQGREVFHTDSLLGELPGSEKLRETASGVLAISISKLYSSYVYWFRPEVVRTVEWGGDPRKPVETDGTGTMRIHPRKSFEAWKETVRGRSLPWRQSEIESAGELRNAVIGVVLRKAEELAAVSAELKRSNKELEAFSYSVSHDLRAPFRHIVGYSELLGEHLDDALDAKGKRYLQTISNAAESAGTLVDNLLNFSRVGRAKLNVVPLDTNRLIQEVMRYLPADDDDTAPVTWDIGKLPQVQGDPTLLRLVWQNLLANALKFTRARETRRISVQALEDEAEVVFSVSDNGVGFKQAYVHKLFGVFQRLHSQEEFEGTGIGLANVRRAVGKHGGRTWAEGELDKGATFYFSIPRRVIPERGADA